MKTVNRAWILANVEFESQSRASRLIDSAIVGDGDGKPKAQLCDDEYEIDAWHDLGGEG